MAIHDMFVVKRAFPSSCSVNNQSIMVTDTACKTVVENVIARTV